MGCDAGNPNDACDGDEAPMHSVTFTEGLSILRTEVTADQYLANPQLDCGGSLDLDPIWSGAEPAAGLDWCASDAWCSSLGSGWGLCSEAQWEYAARGSCAVHGSSSGPECRAWMPTYAWGNQAPTCSLATYLGCTGEAQPVEQLAFGASALPGASPWGVLQMSGNIWEWVEDCYRDSYSGAPSDGSAWTTAPCTLNKRIIRGGWYYGDPTLLRTADRGASYPTGKGNGVGFRCCRPD